MEKSRLQSQLKELSKVRNLDQAKAWWNSLSVKEKSIVIGVLAAAISTPLFISAAAKMTSTHFVADAGVLYLVEVAAPFWTKFLFVVAGVTAVGVGANVVTQFSYENFTDSLETI